MHHPLSSLPSLDADHSFGRPKAYLTPHAVARLTLVCSRLGDTRAEREAEAHGPAVQRPRRRRR